MNATQLLLWQCFLSLLLLSRQAKQVNSQIIYTITTLISLIRSLLLLFFHMQADMRLEAKHKAVTTELEGKHC